MRRVFRVVLVLALLCCCSCVFAVKGGKEQEPQVTQVDAECAGKDKLGRWQLPGKSLWYNCTAAARGFGQMICGMGVGNCASEDFKKRIKDGAEHGVFTINVSTFTPSAVKSWWERNVEPKAVTAAIVPAKPPAAEPPSPQEDKDSRETSSRTDSDSSPAVVENSTDVPPSSLPATPGGTGANSAAVAAATTDPSAAASQASESAPSGDPQGPSHSASAASPAPESPPDPEPTEGGDHSSHEPPVELQEETAAPPTQLSQTGEDGSAAGGTEEDTAANTTTDTASGEGNSAAASMPAPLSSAPTTNALEKSVGTDACFHDTRLHALPPLVLAALTYGTLG
ncbi:90 kDa surface protein [Trypanosoma cruzi]|uniref:90 kDa surface protein, putative n=1 Tax=Trypanosoma cruzi (strain CL Brener) TaxID=353153 RepID=Q4E456_TRYCC|nr:90 kDa surface protein, putative [Trypanosoma cruzi]EAN99566.1 90 kDa surface protein, putative [Trypanosoma cruzi]RNC43853.1 90 kDa surface protein [Trypanosoma cruzi]|eukprot:XP_821417.1 90 kDa surface protein [Trypanosoma cruzi strain CL Brener]